MSTNFEKVREFHKLFGLKISNTTSKDMFEDKKTLKLRLDLLKEELSELIEAIDNKDIVEIGDALTDIAYVNYGAAVSWGIDLDDCFKKVHESNMSKLCSSEQEAKDTVEWYKKNSEVYDSPEYRKNEEKDNCWVVYNKSTGKILKSINYNAVDLTFLNPKE